MVQTSWTNLSSPLGSPSVPFCSKKTLSIDNIWTSSRRQALRRSPLISPWTSRTMSGNFLGSGLFNLHLYNISLRHVNFIYIRVSPHPHDMSFQSAYHLWLIYMSVCRSDHNVSKMHMMWLEMRTPRLHIITCYILGVDQTKNKPITPTCLVLHPGFFNRQTKG